MERQKTVAVIGAGMCGLLSMKSLKEEGLDFVCFENTGYCGGLWRYHDDDTPGVASVMKTTVINTSKELGALSDFPPPAEFPNYMNHELMYQYLSMIAQKIDAQRYIKFHHQVTDVTPTDDYKETGKWVVTAVDTQSNVESSTVFNGVMVCTGHHIFPNMPSFPGMDEFEGRIMHTHSLKKVQEFENQRVVVVGTGSSGLDAAVAISNVAKQVYLSSRRGTWVVSRLGQYGNPADASFNRRSRHFIRQCLPFNVVSSLAEEHANKQFNHFLYNLNPKHRILSQQPAVSDQLPFKLISGAVIMRGTVKKFTNTGVIFEEEQEVTVVDAVIFATGYQIKFPFLSDSILKVENNWVRLYKNVYPPHLPHPTLAIIGLIQTNGPGLPPAEMQTRWSAMVMNGKCSLPSQDEMLRDILKKEATLRRTFVDSPRHTVQVEWIDYQDELATLIGVKPNFWKMAFTDPELFKACVKGPSLPYQYRLQGPYPWDGARNAILTYKDRMKGGFGKPRENKIVKSRRPGLTTFTGVKIAFLLLLLSLYLIFLNDQNHWNILFYLPLLLLSWNLI